MSAQTNYYPLLKRWCVHSIVHSNACVKTPNSIIKSYRKHSAQSDLKHKRYSTLMIFMQILELFFVFCPTVDFWYNQLITNHPDKPIWKIYKHQQTNKTIWRGNKCPWKFTKLSGELTNLTNDKPISWRCMHYWHQNLSVLIQNSDNATLSTFCAVSAWRMCSKWILMPVFLPGGHLIRTIYIDRIFAFFWPPTCPF